MKPADQRLPGPRAYYLGADEDMSATASELIDHVPNAVDTGLLDAFGNPIVRYRAVVKFGFVP